MATVKIGEALGDFQVIPSFYDLHTLEIVKNKPNFVGFQDTGSDFEVEFHGTGLGIRKGFLNKGVVDEVNFMNGDGEALFDIRDDKFDVENLSKAAKSGGFSEMLQVMFKGDDTFTGSTHADYIFAGGGDDTIKAGAGADLIFQGGGNDKIIGGIGFDTISCGKGAGKDVILDFDPSTWNPDDPDHSSDPHGHFCQDVIATNDDFKIIQHGQDTVISFGHGSTVTLKNVDADLVDATDFIPAIF